MQIATHYEDDRAYRFELPNEDAELMSNVKWGSVSNPFTPAFWRYACTATGAVNRARDYRLGKSLREELVACLLGGHGVSGELSTGAFQHLRALGLICRMQVSASELEDALLMPLHIKGRTIHYRYPAQKAKYIAAALAKLEAVSKLPTDPIDFRNWLTTLPGVGMKTASWITRNWLDADCVAILDIHVHRAGVIAGFFAPNEDIIRSYTSMERRFVRFADAIGVPANVLDHQIWNRLRIVPTLVRRQLLELGVRSTDRCGLPTRTRANPDTPQTADLFSAA